MREAFPEKCLRMMTFFSRRPVPMEFLILNDSELECELERFREKYNKATWNLTTSVKVKLPKKMKHFSDVRTPGFAGFQVEMYCSVSGKLHLICMSNQIKEGVNPRERMIFHELLGKEMQAVLSEQLDLFWIAKVEEFRYSLDFENFEGDSDPYADGYSVVKQRNIRYGKALFFTLSGGSDAGLAIWKGEKLLYNFPRTPLFFFFAKQLFLAQCEKKKKKKTKK